jgi:hypothetical protein
MLGFFSVTRGRPGALRGTRCFRPGGALRLLPSRDSSAFWLPSLLTFSPAVSGLLAGSGLGAFLARLRYEFVCRVWWRFLGLLGARFFTLV